MPEARAFASLRIVPSALLLLAACHTPTPPIVNPHPAPHDMGLRRDRWMFEQRAYPFGSIPADGRRKALAEVERTRIAVNAVASDASSAAVWRSIGPEPVRTKWPWGAATGRVKALAVSPASSDIVLAGSSGGGIWRSTDGGRNFDPVSDDQADLAVGAIAFAPSSPNIVYAAMGSDFLGTGLLRSDDAGMHWRLVSGNTFGPRGTTPRLIVDPLDPNRLWVAQYSRLAQSGQVFSSGVLFSQDGGVTWAKLFGGLTSDLVATPGSTSQFLAGITRVDRAGGNAGIYRTTNGGATWSPVVDSGVQTYAYPRLAVTPAAPTRVYAHMFSSGPSGLKYQFLVSENGGATFAERPALGLEKDFAVFVQADPTDPLVVYVGLKDLYKSSDGGQTFVNLTRGYRADGEFDPENSTSHVDQHALAFDPRDSRTLFLGNDGGVFFSDDAGLTFDSLSGALSLVQAYGIAAHPTDPASLFLGTQDNGMERREANGTWRELITGDYGSILFDRNNPEILVTNYVEGLIMSFTGRGEFYLDTVATNDTFGGNRVAFIAPFEHARATNTLYFGTYRLFLSVDFGASWFAPAGLLDLTKGGSDTLAAIGLAASNPQMLYTGSNQGRVMVTRDGGSNWTDVTAGLPDRAVRAVAVDRTNPEVAYAGFSGYAAPHVWKTTNGGATWQQLDQGLPDIPVNALLLDRQDRNVIYAGTDIGVFRYDARVGQWEPFSRGMPPVMVMDFDVTANGTIVAATHGRGAYELVGAPGVRRRGVRH